MRAIKTLSLITFLVCVFFAGCHAARTVSSDSQVSRTVYLDELDITKASTGWGKTQRNKSIDGNVLTIDGKQYSRGIGTHASGNLVVELNKGTKRFTALVGIDDEVKGAGSSAQAASVEFMVIGDKKILFKSGIMKSDMPAKTVDVDLTGVNMLILGVTEGDNNSYDHADWVDAKFEVIGETPKAIDPPAAKPYILTPKPGPKPRITGPKIFGVRPGSQFLFTVTATGNRPMSFIAEGLPDGLKIDSKTGRITGVSNKRGEYIVKLTAANKRGKSRRDFKIVVGDTICLTPPMGWNSWYCWSASISDEKVRDVAKAMVEKGLADHGWSYVNIDDCWQGERGGEFNAIQGNERFHDMKGMCDYVHSLGLKVGIYSTPWMGSYAGFIGGSAPSEDGSYSQHALAEEKRPQKYQFFGPYPGTHKLGTDRIGAYWFAEADAKQWAKWGIDYVKYDWKPNDVPTAKRLLESLSISDRDIVYSISNAAPYKNAAELSKLCNLWRTTGDIHDSWRAISGIGFSQDKWRQFAGPGHWNDPDMLQVGSKGVPNQYVRQLKPTRLTCDEQYTQVSLWSLLASPLLLSCDIENMDEFTLSLLTNDEVLDVNQDPLGRQANRILKDGEIEVWAKDMEDGSKAVGLFNRGNAVVKDVTIDWHTLGIKGRHTVRDLWRQKDLGRFSGDFTAEVPAHGVVLVRIFK